MHETPSGLPASRSEFLEFVEASPFAEILRDESRLRTIILDAMKQSDDPMAREIGEGLASGTMSSKMIATTSAYSEFLNQGLSALRQFDFAAMNEQLKASIDSIPETRAVHDDEEDLWQGLRRHRR
jgi:hypothetical protein